MTPEQKFFLQVLSDHLSKRHTIPVNDVDWNILFKLSRAHQVEGVVFYQCRDFIPARYAFEESFYATLYYNKNRRIIMSEIEEDLSRRHIPFFTVKGFEIARYYPVPNLRSMGDNDIIVNEEDKEMAGNALLRMGFIYSSEFVGKEKIYSYKDMQFDLHHRLIYDESITVPEQEHFFNDCWKYVRDGKLDHSFHFLFLIVHLRKHLMNEGVGFRQFMDLALIGKNDSELDWQWIDEKLEELKLKKFAEKCFALIEFWFGICLPVKYSVVEKAFGERATQMIFDNGVFGFNNDSNQSNSVINRLRRLKCPRWLGRIVLLTERVFPGYEFLCTGDSYAFLRGRPFLLPAAWIYRIYLMATGKTTSGNKALSQIMIPAKEIELREDDMRQWGLVD